MATPTRANATKAKARAATAVKEGRMSRDEQRRINAKADLMLYGGRGDRGHVFVADDSGKGAPRGRVKPDSQPDYKIKPNTGRNQRGDKPRTPGRRPGR